MRKVCTLVSGVVASMLLLATSALAQTAKAELKDAKGASVGTVDLADVQRGVLFKIAVKGLPAGVHAFHIHAVGKCDAPAFTTAGGHFNPGNRKHGFMAAEGSHAGDLPNLYVPASGDLTIEDMVTDVTLKKGERNSLFDQDGSALVIHEKADDYKTDPAGDSGARIACGVIGP